jgi:hypothetical protein
MTALTGLGAVDVVLASLYVLAAVVTLGALLPSVPGTRVGPFAIVPAILGGAGLVLLAALYGLPAVTAESIGIRTVAVWVVIVFVVVAVAEFLLIGLPRVISEVGGTSIARRPDLILLVTVGGPLLAGLIGFPFVESRLGPATDRLIRATLELPGMPLGMAPTSGDEGYISLAEGGILRYRLTDDGTLETRSVVSGLGFLRGIAVIDRTLFVAELTGLPCDPPIPECKGYSVGASPADGERAILSSATGRILAFDVVSTQLRDRRVLVDDLPVVNTEHGVNGLAAGPDGRLYVSIGNLEILWRTPDAVDDLDVRRPDLLGTIIAVDPASGDVEVFARGLRNVFGLTFDPEGNLYGVDNDGPTRDGWRAEELLLIQGGKDYGYPVDATYGAPNVRNGFPLWTLDTWGSAGIGWVETGSGAPRLLVGAAGQIVAIGMRDLVAGGTKSRPPVSTIATFPGFVTDVEWLPGGELLATVFKWDRTSTLYVLENVGE